MSCRLRNSGRIDCAHLATPVALRAGDRPPGLHELLQILPSRRWQISRRGAQHARRGFGGVIYSISWEIPCPSESRLSYEFVTVIEKCGHIVARPLFRGITVDNTILVKRRLS